MKQWVIGTPDPQQVQQLLQSGAKDRLCAKILAQRGYSNYEEAEKFFSASERIAPSLLPDMERAAEILFQAIETQTKICIYGDYDCDGVCATTILYSYLSFQGADVCWRIPEREEGYGLNEQAVREMHEQGVELIVTVDNGISAQKEAELIYELGMRLLITDHHQPSENLPRAEAIVNAHLKTSVAPFHDYCGAGIALKLVAQMEQENDALAMEQYGDLAAIATVADIVSLSGENRSIVKEGLQMLKNTENIGLRALMKANSVKSEELNATDISFRISPLINAAGRFSSPTLAVRLLLSETEEEADNLAREIMNCNIQRKNEETLILREVEEQIQHNPALLEKRVLVFAGNHWNFGVIGIVASRLVDRYGKPSFVLSYNDTEARGSARGFGAFSIYDCLADCSTLLKHWGGHPGAGGFSLAPEDIESFDQLVQKHSLEHFPIMPNDKLMVDCVLEPDELSELKSDSRKIFEPCGFNNPKPCFALLGARVLQKGLTKSGRHTRIQLSYGRSSLTAFAFSVLPEQYFAEPNMLIDAVVDADNGFITIKDARPTAVKQRAYFAAYDTYEKILRGEPLTQIYLEHGIPSRNEMVQVYQSLGEGAVSSQVVYMRLAEKFNVCKVLLALRVFEELEFIRWDHCSEILERIPSEKKDLNQSALYCRLQNILQNQA